MRSSRFLLVLLLWTPLLAQQRADQEFRFENANPAQDAGGGFKMGMNHPQAGQNARFCLNVLHWLTGLNEESPPGDRK